MPNNVKERTPLFNSKSAPNITKETVCHPKTAHDYLVKSHDANIDQFWQTNVIEPLKQKVFGLLKLMQLQEPFSERMAKTLVEI